MKFFINFKKASPEKIGAAPLVETKGVVKPATKIYHFLDIVNNWTKAHISRIPIERKL